MACENWSDPYKQTCFKSRFNLWQLFDLVHHNWTRLRLSLFETQISVTLVSCGVIFDPVRGRFWSTLRHKLLIDNSLTEIFIARQKGEKVEKTVELLFVDHFGHLAIEWPRLWNLRVPIFYGGRIQNVVKTAAFLRIQRSFLVEWVQVICTVWC